MTADMAPSDVRTGARARPHRTLHGPRVRAGSVAAGGRAGCSCCPRSSCTGSSCSCPLLMTVQYSTLRWNGIGPSEFVGIDNYVKVLTDPDLLGHHPQRLQAGHLLQRHPGRRSGCSSRRSSGGWRAARLGAIARTVLFLPQVIPLVAAGIVWRWMLSNDGLVNQFLDAASASAASPGPGSPTSTWRCRRSGVIGAWVLIGLCIVLLLTGMSKIDQALYEAARIDGATAWQEFRSITVPSLRYEIGVCVTVTVIASLAAFDIIYISTRRRSGHATMVPGLEIYRLAFFGRQVGPRLRPRRRAHAARARRRAAHPAAHAGGATDDRQPARGVDRPAAPAVPDRRHDHPVPEPVHDRAPPVGQRAAGPRLARPTPSGATSWRRSSRPTWSALLASSVLIVLGVVPVVGGRSRRWPASASATCGSAAPRFLFMLFLLGLTLPFEGIIIPLYYLVRELGILNTKLAIILPLIGLYMPFGVFWMRAHFVNMPTRAVRGRAGRRRHHLGSCSGASTCRSRMPAISSLAILLVGLDVEPVPAGAGARRRPDRADDGRRAGRLPGPLRDGHPAAGAGSLLILTPTLIVFVIFQRQFISALLQGSLKG